MLTYVLILLLGHFALMTSVPWWTWSRLQLLRLTADTVLAMSVVDIGLTVLLPSLVQGWAWTPALHAAVFRLETSIGLTCWYALVSWRFGRFHHPARIFWVVGTGAMLATDLALLWGTFLMERGITSRLLGAGMPFWMVHQTLWSLGLYRTLDAPPAWSTTLLAAPVRGPLLRWTLSLQQGVVLILLALIVGGAQSLRATIWFVVAFVLGQVMTAYSREQEREEREQANAALSSANRRLQEAQRQLVQLNSALTSANGKLQEIRDRQATALEQRQIRAAEVAHDMGNELQDIKLALAMVRAVYRRRREPIPAELQEQLGAAEASIAVTDGLLSAMVAAAQLDAGALQIVPQSTDTAELLQRVARQLGPRAAELRVALRLELPPTLPALHCDPELTTRALLNVVRNALQYTAQARPEDGGQVVVSGSAGDARVQIAVVDNGPGIAAEQLAQLGQHFVRAVDGPEAPAGFGLGLAFARGVIEQHPAGALSVDSVLGQGTTVRITLAQAILLDDTLSERTVGG
jgi:signal transduction histidine kinase